MPHGKLDMDVGGGDKSSLCPCQNGGRCVTLVDSDQVYCDCPPQVISVLKLVFHRELELLKFTFEQSPHKL